MTLHIYNGDTGEKVMNLYSNIVPPVGATIATGLSDEPLPGVVTGLQYIYIGSNLALVRISVSASGNQASATAPQKGAR